MSVDTTTKSLLITFNLPIYTRQIRNWRGAFIEMAGWEDTLFHNHKSKDEYHYRYPKIQYRVKGGKAAIFAIGDGVQALQQILATSNWQINWNGEVRSLQIEDLRMNEHYIRMLPEPKTYKLYKWLALNKENHARWQACEGIIERIALLEKLLGNHLVAGLWGLDYEPSERVVVKLQEIRHTQPVRYHEAKLLAFDIVFTSNILLPSGMAIGKGVSHGFGWTVPKTIKKGTSPKRSISNTKMSINTEQ